MIYQFLHLKLKVKKKKPSYIINIAEFYFLRICRNRLKIDLKKKQIWKILKLRKYLRTNLKFIQDHMLLLIL